MVFTPWQTAHGDAEPAFLTCADVVSISPSDDSIDTNDVIIEGAGEIMSFGDSPHHVIKRIKFVPLVLRTEDDKATPPSASIKLINSTHLNLLGKKDRSIGDVSYGMYLCDGNNRWDEVYFVAQGSALVSELEERVRALEDQWQQFKK